MIVLGIGREIFQAVLIATLSAVTAKLVDFGFDELKERTARRARRKVADKDE